MEDTKKTIIEKYEALASVEDRYRKAFFIIEYKVKDPKYFHAKDLKEITNYKYANMAEVTTMLRNNNLIKYAEGHTEENPRPYSLVDYAPIDSKSLTKEDLSRLFRAATGILRNINCEKYFLYLAREKYLSDFNKTSTWKDIETSESPFGFIVEHLEGKEAADTFEAKEPQEKEELNLYIKALKNLLENLKFKSVNKDAVSEVFENLFGDVSLSENKDSFYTPKEVNELVSKLVDIEPNSTVMDFAAGTGALLSAINKKNAKKGIKFSGIEIDEKTKELCDFNLNSINGINAVIETEDALLYSSDKKFDYVITNPPWNLTGYDKEKLENEIKYIQKYEGKEIFPIKNSADVAFVQLATYYADKKAVIIIDSAFLSRAGNEKRLRAWLLEKDILETIIFLPEKVFYNTAFAGAILIINKNKAKNEKVRIINAEKFCESHSYRKNTNLLTNLDEIVEIYNNFEKVSDISKDVSTGEIIKKDYDLNLNLYLKEKKEEIDTKSCLKKLGTLNLKYGITLHHIEKEFDITKYEKVNFSKVAEFTRGLNFKASELSVPTKNSIAIFKSVIVPEDNIKYIPSSLIEKDDSRIIKAGDILISVFGTNREILGKTLLITEEILNKLPKEVDRKATISSTLAILRIKDLSKHISSEYLEFVINSDKFKQHYATYFRTSNIANISKQIIDKFEVPIPSSIEELVRITGLFIMLNNLNNSITEQLDQINNIKNGIIQELY